MRQRPIFPEGISSSPTLFVTVVFLFLGLIGCGDSCLVIVSDPGGVGGVVTGSIPNCSLNISTGNVQVRVASSLAASTTSDASPTAHIFITIRGTEANPSATADEESSGWEELAPNLATQPEQIDLLAHSAGSCDTRALGDVRISANQYRQIRLRLLDNDADFSNFVLQRNSCGSLAFNCVVTHDGEIRPLEIGDKPSTQILISPQNIPGGFFRVLPDAASELEIKFAPQSSRWVPASEIARLVPVFTAAQQASCQTEAAANR
jgi:hypothetical protein